MSAELVSIVALAAMFLTATVLPVNMGALAFVAAFLVGTFAAGMESNEILAGFPGDIFVVLVGITYLFAIAQNNGTIDWLVQLSVRAVRGRLAAIPWVMFAMAALLTSIGAVSPAAVAIIAPIALGFAAKYRINPLLMGVMVVHGAQAGGFSPISIYGGIVNQVVERSGLPGNETALFLSSLAFNAGIAAVVFVVFGGLALVRRRHVENEAQIREEEEEEEEEERVLVGAAAVSGSSSTGRSSGSSGTTTPSTGGGTEAGGMGSRPTVQQGLTVVGLVGLAVTTLVFKLDVGLVAMTVAVLLALASPAAQKKAVSQISWPVVLLISGVLTYVSVLEEIGTIDYVGDAVARVGTPLLAALLLCVIGAVVSAFASSVGVLGATIPLAVPFLLQGDVGTVGMIAALAISSTVVDVSPFSTNGALVVANAQDVDKEAFFRKLLAYGAVVVVAAPLVTWLTLIVPGWL
jgi:di/tricarboxylate transporter